MRINGPGVFSSQQQIFTELNLKEGQKVIGKVIRFVNDEALLEIAGRPLQAKIEGNPSLTGSPQTFIVGADEQGRVILKVQSNPQEAAGGSAAPGNNGAANSVSIAPDGLAQKSILSALAKEGLPASSENIQKVTQYMQEFQTKYQQPIDPQVFTFILTRKWPVTPATVLASWIHQDPEAREALWQKFQENLPDAEGSAFQAKWVMNMGSNAPEIAARLRLQAGFKLQGLLEKLGDFWHLAKNKGQTAENPLGTSSKAAAPFDLKMQLLSTIKNELAPKGKPARQSVSEGLRPGTDDKTVNSKTDLPVPSQSSQPSLPSSRNVPLTKEKTASLSSSVTDQAVSETQESAADKSGPSQAKIQSVLDQNIGINKAILKETAANGASNIIPLLVIDSQSALRECMVQWKEEKSTGPNSRNDQVVYMTIPTDNLGDINLALRIGAGGTQINLRVSSEEVRRYIMQHTPELKTDIARDNAFISINLKENETGAPSLHGVDLWM